MSEGWGDFVAVKMHVREGDDLDGAFAAAAYATQNGYFGIRRVPYSANFAKNALTFRHISDGEALPDTHPVDGGGRNSEVHNAGEIWSSVLFDAYISLLKESRGENPRYTFAEAQRRMSDYMVAGLMMMPPNATYTEARDSILAAAAAADDQDLEILANAFARRGMGTAAVAPPRESTDLTGVVESFTNGGALKILSAQLELDVDCDQGCQPGHGRTRPAGGSDRQSRPDHPPGQRPRRRLLSLLDLPGGSRGGSRYIAPL